jgi:transketolase
MLGDGENDEGQVWEAAMAAVKFKLDNLVAIVDHNKYQQTGPTAEVLDLSPLIHKWAAFGWSACEINGHNLTEVLGAFDKARQTKGKPSAIIAHTEKGHGIKSLLAELKDTNFHGKSLPKDVAQKALAMIGE